MPCRNSKEVERNPTLLIIMQCRVNMFIFLSFVSGFRLGLCFKCVVSFEVKTLNMLQKLKLGMRKGKSKKLEQCVVGRRND